MHVVILGCGRVGSAVARTLERLEHSVAVIDQDATAFRRLGDGFVGQTVTGVGFDRDTLIEAGIERAEAFAAVSSGDNSNIIAARVARETFNVARVAARIYDPRRAEVYERLGIPTVATVRWTADQLVRRLVPEGSLTEWTDASGRIVLVEIAVHKSWVGRALPTIEDAISARVICLTRLGEGMLVGRKTLLQEGDLLHVAVEREKLAEIEAVLATRPVEA